MRWCRSTWSITETHYTLPDGLVEKITVGISSNGVLLVTVSKDMKSTMDEKHLTLIGIAIAKQKFATKVANIKGVLLEEK
ncbi:MAG: hypothetical protein HON68_03720 [Gammaproteobacteria bacterium]|jgi:hypothetical protein|nr:hypothetical protein [Gammaproteobacteria bacterium]MBT3489190.1 hypothetical protein [Gammaproteobacteria bacterium]MBT3718079.1 hypothetical protein [Gammaproteobacteria bacterium]MBT3845126.1 hypothetical protein [Gammaproteobacteria bacterium]MBT3893492.1 hypothetical protein [Gammaproteobacteria bacterium]